MKFKTRFFLSFFSTAVIIAMMLVQGAPLKAPEISPQGIINYELAGTVSKASAIYKAWSPSLINTAVNHIKLDFFFILSYSYLLFIVCFRITKQSPSRLKKIGRWLCAAVIVAAFFDVFENVLMLRTLTGHFSKEVVASTFFFASVKFLLVALSIVFIAVSFSARLLIKKEDEVVSVV